MSRVLSPQFFATRHSLSPQKGQQNMKSTTYLLSIILLVGSASAHTIFQQLWVNGVGQGYNNGIRVPDYDGVRIQLARVSATKLMLCLQPITDVTSNDLICNGGINPYHQPLSKSILTVPAGAQVTAEVRSSCLCGSGSG